MVAGTVRFAVAPTEAGGAAADEEQAARRSAPPTAMAPRAIHLLVMPDADGVSLCSVSEPSTAACPRCHIGARAGVAEAHDAPFSPKTHARALACPPRAGQTAGRSELADRVVAMEAGQQ